MGCNCGKSTERYYLVTMNGSGDQELFTSEVAARIAATANGGGGWVEVDPENYRALVAEGIPTR